MSRSNANEPSDSKASYSIGAVSRLTGLTTHTLRMWEHRYGTIVAERQDNGRRIYTPADVEKLSMLKVLTDRGSPISSITNMSIDDLRARLEQDQSLGHSAVRDTIRIAAMGATIPQMLRNVSKQVEGFRLIAASTEPETLDADISGQPLDVLVLEFPVLNQHSMGLVQEMYKHYRSPYMIVVYRYGRSADESILTTDGIVTMRNPVSDAELVAAISARTAVLPATQLRKNSDDDSVERRNLFAAAPARRFDNDQLARLSQIESLVDCECPHHLAEILAALTAFEVYSRNCEETDSSQAELHAYLHNATGHARGIIEQALSHLIEIEGITI